jgi:hypothetical protein
MIIPAENSAVIHVKASKIKKLQFLQALPSNYSLFYRAPLYITPNTGEIPAGILVKSLKNKKK